MSDNFQGLFEVAKSIADRLLENKSNEVIVISHIDADGLTAASIASLTLNREQIKHEVKFVKQLDDKVIMDLQNISLKSSNGKKDILFWFADLGSGMCKHISKFNPIITDHHAPNILDYDIPKKARGDLLEFSSVIEHQMEKYHLNPHLHNLDGTYDISGAGTVYLVTRALSQNNVDLAYLAIIGAVGDLQDSRFHRLIGTNRKILTDAENTGKIKTITDISTFGRETRQLKYILMYSTDPYLPSLTMNEINCINFFKKLEIPLKSNGRARTWADLTKTERRTIISELMEILLSKGIGHKEALRLMSEVYILPNETKGTVLHDAKEFSTLLNSCGKYNKPEIGYQICLGDRGESLNNAFQLLKGHKSILVEGMQYVKDLGIIDYGEIQYFDAGDRIPENVVGTIASMLLGNNEANTDKPLFGFALAEDDQEIKVSARTTRALVNRGLNLSEVMRQTSETLGCGSVGGGHDIAAGATIPANKQQEFLKHAEQIVKQQLNNK